MRTVEHHSRRTEDESGSDSSRRRPTTSAMRPVEYRLRTTRDAGNHCCIATFPPRANPVHTIEPSTRATHACEPANGAGPSVASPLADDERAGRSRLGSAFFLALIDGLASRAIRPGTPRSGGGLG